MSSWLVYPFAFILVITLLVAVHELGHYLVARWSGVRVLKFSIGFGPVLASRTDRLGTQFAVSAIPLGGYITMLDQHTREQAPQQEGAPPVAFEDLSMSWRMGILAAGPLANLLLGVFAYAAVFHMGVPQAQPIIEPTGHGLAREAGLTEPSRVDAVDGRATPSAMAVRKALLDRIGDTGEIHFALSGLHDGAEAPPLKVPIRNWLRGAEDIDLPQTLGLRMSNVTVLGDVVPDGPADRAGLRQWDKVLEVAGAPVGTWVELRKAILASPGEAAEWRVLRQSGTLSLVVVHGVRPCPQDAAQSCGIAGIMPPVATVSHTGMESIWAGAVETWSTVTMTLGHIAKLVTGDISIRHMGGPIAIAKVSGDSAQVGARPFLTVVAVISISIGILNLLPVPQLDGGRMLILAVEWVFGGPLPARVARAGDMLGWSFLMCLMTVVLFNDAGMVLKSVL